MRTEFSAKTKAQAFERSGGNCEKCGCKLQAGRFRYDHIIPDWIGGPNHLDNCRVQCIGCDAPKTANDQKVIAKTKRIRKKHIMGIEKKSRFPCSRNSKWKKKISGEVIRR